MARIKPIAGGTTVFIVGVILVLIAFVYIEATPDTALLFPDALSFVVVPFGLVGAYIAGQWAYNSIESPVPSPEPEE